MRSNPRNKRLNSLPTLTPLDMLIDLIGAHQLSAAAEQTHDEPTHGRSAEQQPNKRARQHSRARAQRATPRRLCPPAVPAPVPHLQLHARRHCEHLHLLRALLRARLHVPEGQGPCLL